MMTRLFPILGAGRIAAALAVLVTLPAFGQHFATSTTFKGVKANAGTVAAARDGEALVLTLSDDFVTPDTPDPHWQIVDSKGEVYLMKRLMIKDGKFNKSLVVPCYVRDVAKVQIWCAFAETNLGEATFKTAIR